MPNPSELYRQELEEPPVFASDRFEVSAEHVNALAAFMEGN